MARILVSANRRSRNKGEGVALSSLYPGYTSNRTLDAINNILEKEFNPEEEFEIILQEIFSDSDETKRIVTGHCTKVRGDFYVNPEIWINSRLPDFQFGKTNALSFHIIGANQI